MLQPPFTASLAMVLPSNGSMHQAAMSLRAHASFSCMNGFQAFQHLVENVQTFFSSPSWAVPIPTEELKTGHNMQALTGGFLHTLLLLEVVPCSRAWTLCAVRYCTVDRMHPIWSRQRPKSCRSALEHLESCYLQYALSVSFLLLLTCLEEVCLASSDLLYMHLAPAGLLYCIGCGTQLFG